MSSPADHLGAVRRSLSTISRDGEQLRLLTVERTLDAGLDDVWDALSDGGRVSRWLLPVSGDLRPGGTYRLEGGAHGEVLECLPPERLAVTWVHGDASSWVDVTLRPTDGGTLLQLAHSAPVDPAAWAQLGPGAVGIGWELALLGLVLHLGDPAVVPREQTEGIPGLAELVRGSSEAWARASIDAGTPAEQATAAAERCTAAYTASPG